jgi:hypothetical protein
MAREALTADNWRRATLEAVEGLPEDVRGSVGHEQTAGNVLTIRVAVEPIEAGTEAEICRVRVTWWGTLEAAYEAATAEDRAAGYDGENYQLDVYRKMRPEALREPSVAVAGDSSGFIDYLVPGRASVGDLRRNVQAAILEEMFSGGGISMVSKDRRGRFVREDGTPILRWQFRRQR